MAVKTIISNTIYDPDMVDAFNLWADNTLTVDERREFHETVSSISSILRLELESGRLKEDSTGWVWENQAAAESFYNNPQRLAGMQKYYDRWIAENNITIQPVTFQEI